MGSRAAVPSRFRLPRWATALALALLSLGCRHDGASVFVDLIEARRLAADLRIQLNREGDSSNRAVMADTDEASINFARDAEQTTRVVESDAAALTPLLRGLGFPNEIRLLEEFGTQFAKYRDLDRNILELAVENTNLKAQRLSFGAAREAADAFRDALGTLTSAERCRLENLVSKAVLAVREIQVLHAPHIAEPDDAAMTHIEEDMAAREAAARGALSSLAVLVGPETPPALAAAQSALDRFNDVSRQIVRLSRRNSNVRSLDLSLREKPALAGACDDSLRQLQEALAKEGSKATR